MGRSMSSRHVVQTSEQEDLKAMLRDLELKDKANNNVYGEFLTSNTILACQHGVKKQSLGSSSLKYTKIGDEEVLIDKDKNIRGTFGVCKSPKFAGLSSTTTIQVSASESIDGTAKTVGGHMCYMQLAQKWGALTKEIMVYDSSTHDYREIPTTNSYILCHYGQGCIYPIDSGQRVTVKNTQGSGQIVTLTQMQQVERTDTQGNAVEAWRFNSLRDILSWSTATYIPTYTAHRSIEQKDVDAINACLAKYNITGDQIPHFIAQCSHECGCGASGIERYGGNDPATYFRDRDIKRENFDAADLAATAHIWNNTTAIEQYALANNFKTKYKDYGAKYRGAGALQMTHYCEYKPYSDYIGDATILTEGSGRVAEAYFWDSAGWLWKEHYKMHEKFANGAVPTVKDITFKINGGYNGLAERENFYKCCKVIF